MSSCTSRKKKPKSLLIYNVPVGMTSQISIMYPIQHHDPFLRHDNAPTPIIIGVIPVWLSLFESVVRCFFKTEDSPS